MTGAAADTGRGDAFVREGRATLESPVWDTTGWRDPVLRYWVSFAGVRAEGGALVPSAHSRLLILARVVPAPGAPATEDARPDAGAGASDGWVELDRLQEQNTRGWVRRAVPLPPGLLGAGLKLRFVAVDENPRSGGVEAAIDDVEITSNLPFCYEAATVPGQDDAPEGCGCRLGAVRRGGAAPWLLGLLWGAWLVGRRAAGGRSARAPARERSRPEG